MGICMITSDHKDAMINGYDMNMIIDGGSEVMKEVIRDRKVYIVSAADCDSGTLLDDKQTIKMEKRRTSYCNIFIRNKGGKEINCAETLEMSELRENEGLFYIGINNDDSGKIKYAKKLSQEEFYDFLKDKELCFAVSYIEQNGNVENNILQDFCSKFFHLREEDRFLLTDESIDVRMYQQRVDGSNNDIPDSLKPLDIRDFDTNEKLLTWMSGEARDFIEANGDKTDFTTRFSAVSLTTKAQYFLTRFHSNNLWNKNPTNIYCFRISAYLLPGKASANKIKGLTDDKIAYSLDDRTKYFIDSIHFNSDICYDLSSCKDWIKWHYFDVTFA